MGLFFRQHDKLPNTGRPALVTIATPPKLKRWLKYLALSFLSFIVLLASMIFFWKAKFVPPISATVVDASTGKPLPGMSVCLQARIWEFGNVSVLREDQTHTDSSGRFSFAASTHVLEILQSWEGCTIKVTDPKIKDYFPQPCGGFAFLTYDERQVTPKDGTLFYFPVAMVEQLGWHRAVPFGANRKMIFLLGTTIPLIPVLQSPEQCSSARDSSVVGICVGLNGSTEAYRLRRAKPESDSPAH